MGGFAGQDLPSGPNGGWPKWGVLDLYVRTKAQPSVLRFPTVAVCLLTLFSFFDPIGFASSTVDHVPGTVTAVTHIVLFQSMHDADPA